VRKGGKRRGKSGKNPLKSSRTKGNTNFPSGAGDTTPSQHQRSPSYAEGKRVGGPKKTRKARERGGVPNVVNKKKKKKKEGKRQEQKEKKKNAFWDKGGVGPGGAKKTKGDTSRRGGCPWEKK